MLVDPGPLVGGSSCAVVAPLWVLSHWGSWSPGSRRLGFRSGRGLDRLLGFRVGQRAGMSPDGLSGRDHPSELPGRAPVAAGGDGNEHAPSVATDAPPRLFVVVTRVPCDQHTIDPEHLRRGPSSHGSVGFTRRASNPIGFLPLLSQQRK